MDQVCTMYIFCFGIKSFRSKNQKMEQKIDKSAGSGTKTFRPPKNEALFYVWYDRHKQMKSTKFFAIQISLRLNKTPISKCKRETDLEM